MEGSDDRCVRNAAINTDVTKADTQNTVNDAKSKLKMQEITWIANNVRKILGLNPKKYYSSSTKKEKKAMVANVVRETEEDRKK